MIDEKLLISDLESKIADLQRGMLHTNQDFGRSVLTSMISCYKSVIKSINNMPVKDTESIKYETNILNGWVSRAKDDQLWLHYCEGKPDQIRGDWFGNEYDTPIKKSLFPLLGNSDGPIEVDIILKRKK